MLAHASLLTSFPALPLHAMPGDLSGVPYTANNCAWECVAAYNKVTLNGVEMCRPGQGVHLVDLQPSSHNTLREVAGAMCGRVEVYNYEMEEWGTVCDDFWEDVDAQVVCAELGCSGGAAAMQGFGGGSGAIWLDDIKCESSEASLSQCAHNGWGVHNCQHSEDAGACCAGLDPHTATCGAPA